MEGFQCPVKKFQCRACLKFGHFTIFAIKRNKLCSSLAEQRGINCKQEQCMCVRMPYMASLERVPLMTNFACNSKYSNTSQCQEGAHTISFDYKSYLQGETSSYKKSVYWGKIRHLCRCECHTCQCIQISVKDLELKKLDPNTMEIQTYTTNTVKIVGSCIFFLVHQGIKKLQEVTFFVAENDGSVFLSNTTTLAFGLIQPRTRLDYLTIRDSLITSSVDHPRKTKYQVTVHSS